MMTKDLYNSIVSAAYGAISEIALLSAWNDITRDKDHVETRRTVGTECIVDVMYWPGAWRLEVIVTLYGHTYVGAHDLIDEYAGFLDRRQQLSEAGYFALKEIKDQITGV